MPYGQAVETTLHRRVADPSGSLVSSFRRGRYYKRKRFPNGAIRRGDWKLIEFFDDGTLELYNLAEDISEKNNLANKLWREARELRRELVKWRQEVGATRV